MKRRVPKNNNYIENLFTIIKIVFNLARLDISMSNKLTLKQKNDTLYK